MTLTDTLAAITARIYDINASMEMPVSLFIEYVHGEPKYSANTTKGRQSFDTVEELQDFIANISADPEILMIEFGHGSMRYIVRTAMDPHTAIEYTDADALLAWLEAAVASPDALAEASKYQRMEVLRKRQQEDAEELAKLESAGNENKSTK